MCNEERMIDIIDKIQNQLSTIEQDLENQETILFATNLVLREEVDNRNHIVYTVKTISETLSSVLVGLSKEHCDQCRSKIVGIIELIDDILAIGDYHE